MMSKVRSLLLPHLAMTCFNDSPGRPAPSEWRWNRSGRGGVQGQWGEGTGGEEEGEAVIVM